MGSWTINSLVFLLACGIDQAWAQTQCAQIVCQPGYRVNPSTAHDADGDEQKCCVKTCALHKCEDGYELEPDALTELTLEGMDEEEACCRVKYVDLTSKFDDSGVLEADGKKWKCCCGGGKKGTFAKAGECTLNEIPQGEKQWWETFVKAEGCLKLAGAGMHSFMNVDPPACKVKAMEAFQKIKHNEL